MMRCWSRRVRSASARVARCWGVSICVATVVSASHPKSGWLELLWPLVERWRQEFEMTGRAVLTEGRPTIAMETYVRLMVLKERYRSLVAEVSDSIHLRRFCRISLSERAPRADARRSRGSAVCPAIHLGGSS